MIQLNDNPTKVPSLFCKWLLVVVSFSFRYFNDKDSKSTQSVYCQ